MNDVILGPAWGRGLNRTWSVRVLTSFTTPRIDHMTLIILAPVPKLSEPDASTDYKKIAYEERD